MNGEVGNGHIFRILLIIAILMLSLMSVTPVNAIPPDHMEANIDETGRVDSPCGFDIYSHFYGILHYQNFCDQDGNLIRGHAIYGQANETWSANGKSLSLQVSGPIHYTIVSDPLVSETVLGTNEILTIPGSGRVYGWAGNLVLIWDWSTDPWTFVGVEKEVGALFIAEWDPICAYLAP